MGWSFSFGSIGGIRIRIHVTFLLLLVWLGAAFWHEGGAAAAANGLTYILLLFLCVVLHEFGHILTARHFGAETVDVVLLPIGGVARMKSIPEKPSQELAVALAGPAVNLVIAGALVQLIGTETITRTLTERSPTIAIWPQLAAANLFLALFNLIPAFPMDGGRALRALLGYRLGRAEATALAVRIGHVLAIGFGLLGFMISNPLLILVACFVYFGASAEHHQTQVHRLASRHRVADAMITQFASLPADSRIADAAGLLIHTTQHEIPVVDGAGKVIGLLTRHQILGAMQGGGDDLLVMDAMQSGLPTIRSDAELEEALRLIEANEASALVVADAAGHPVGMVTLANLGQLLLLDRARQRHGGDAQFAHSTSSRGR